jgi:hypothetical protein
VLDVEFEVEFKLEVELKLVVVLTCEGGVTTFESLNLFSWLVTPPTTPETMAQMTIMRMNLFELASVLLLGLYKEMRVELELDSSGLSWVKKAGDNSEVLYVLHDTCLRTELHSFLISLLDLI